MFVDKSQVSFALSLFDREAKDLHRLWLSSSHKRGRQISLEGRNVSEAHLRGLELSGSRFIHCNFRKSFFDRVDFIGAEIDDCIFDETASYGGTYNKALIRNCQFVKTQCKLSNFIDAQIERCNWKDSDCTVTEWTKSQVTNCCFASVEFERSRFHQTHFENCDFSSTRLRAVEAYGTTFRNCDFRHANLNSFILQDTTFINCGFYGYQNKPDIQGKVWLKNSDLSENYDGSQIIVESSLIDEWF
jgi:fluoroquinolone resistance protein